MRLYAVRFTVADPTVGPVTEVFVARDSNDAREQAGYRISPHDPSAGEAFIIEVAPLETPPPERGDKPHRLLVSLKDATAILGVGRTSLNALYDSGRITRYTKSGRPGGDRLVDPEEVKTALRVEDGAAEPEDEFVRRIIADMTEGSTE